jgi:hypothetical protein
MPTISSIAPAMLAISTKLRPSSQKSWPIPRELDRGQRRIHEPAAVGRRAEGSSSRRRAAEQEAPVAVGAEPRERQVARAEHLREQQDGERLDDRHGEQEHHRRAVHGEELVVELRATGSRSRAR